MRRLVVGYGNALREDDGFGPYVIGALAKQPLRADLHACLQLTPELTERLATYDAAIFIDAAFGEPAGVLATPLHFAAPNGLSHHFDPFTLQAMVRTLYGKTVHVELFTAQLEHFGYRQGLGDQARALAERLTVYLAGELQG